MNSYSPSRLFSQELTPTKAIVYNDINSWMETHCKRRTRIPKSSLQSKASKKQTLNTFESLKQQRADIFQKQSLRWKSKKNSGCPTTTSSRNSCSNNQVISNTPISQMICHKSVQVSQFCAQQYVEQGKIVRQKSKKEKVYIRQRLNQILDWKVTYNQYKPLKSFRCRVAKLKNN